MRGNRGLSLVEMTGALALLAIALAMAGTFLIRTPDAAERAAASEAVTRSLENVLDAVRAGAVPLRGGPVENEDLLVRFRGERPSVRLDVSRADVPGLWRVALEASLAHRGQPLRGRVETLVWRAGP